MDRKKLTGTHFVFAGGFYYSGGGWNDFAGTVNWTGLLLESEITPLLVRHYPQVKQYSCDMDWLQIVDRETMKVVANYDIEFDGKELVRFELLPPEDSKETPCSDG